MIPYDIDPSLYTREPEPVVLDDGFSPPHRGEPATPETRPAPANVQVDPAAKSPF